MASAAELSQPSLHRFFKQKGLGGEGDAMPSEWQIGT